MVNKHGASSQDCRIAEEVYGWSEEGLNVLLSLFYTYQAQALVLCATPSRHRTDPGQTFNSEWNG